MTMPESQGREPDMGGAVRGAALIVVIGAALGIAYNAMGLASRPRHGLAWIKQAEKIESLEALQGASGAAAADAGESAGATGASEGAGMSAPGPGVAVAATASASGPAKPAPSSASGTKRDTTAAASSSKGAAAPAPAHGAPAPKKGGTPSGSQAGASAQKPAGTPSGSQAASTQKPPGTPSGSQAGVPAAPVPAAGATTAPAAAAAASADLPVIPDVTGPLKLELATLRKLYAASAALVIDAREAPDYAEGHIGGALSLPYNDAMAEPERVKKLDPAGRPIVIYCSGGDCELSMDLAKLMVESGKRRVLVYEGGFPEWQGAGLPVTKGVNP